MSIKYFANRVKETSTTTGAGNLVLGGPIIGFKTFVSAIGSGIDIKVTYYIYRLDSNLEWEIGSGYIQVSGGLNILVRENVISSSNANSFVNFGGGTKFIESIVSEDRINNGLLNMVEKSGNFSAAYMPTLYVIDSSASGVVVSLPPVSSETESVSLSFVLTKTSGNAYTQTNAIVLTPNGTETINGAGSYDISIKNDYVQIVSLPSQSGWQTLDPIQDATNPYGSDGSIQVKYDGAFSGIDKFHWDFSNSQLLIGGTGTASSASILLSSDPGTSVVFNEQSYANNFRIEGTGASHLFFINGSQNRVSINSSNTNDSLSINSQYGSGITIYRSGYGPIITIGNTTPSGLAINNTIGIILFSGLNTSGNSVEYGKISSSINSNSDSLESSAINMEIMKSGNLEEIAYLGSDGVSIGFNNSNINGIIVGEVCQNDGDNILLGYYHNICGNNCVVLGHNGVLSSGSFGGLIGTNHVASGNNIWIMGGSGVNASGNNKAYLAVDNNNHLVIDKSGNTSSVVFSTGAQVFNLINTYSLSSNANQNINFIFSNSIGTQKTGLLIQSQITDPNNTTEDTTLSAKILVAGSQKEIVYIDNNDTIVGNNIIGSGLNNNVIFGHGLVCSGNSNTVFGSNNILYTGVSNTLVIGNNNYTAGGFTDGNTFAGTLVGNSSYISGNYPVALGFSSVAYGHYSVAIGDSNVYAARSIAIGYDNYLYSSNESGVVIGSSIVNSGKNIVIGNSIQSTGSYNTIISNYSGGYTFNGNNSIQLYTDPNNNISITSSGTQIKTSKCLVVDNASSGSFVSPLQLLGTDYEYQFLYPTGNSIVYLPNGTGLYMGKRFDIFNMHNSHSINVRKSGSASDIEIILAGSHMSIVHGGNNNWVRIISSGIN